MGLSLGGSLAESKFLDRRGVRLRIRGCERLRTAHPRRAEPTEHGVRGGAAPIGCAAWSAEKCDPRPDLDTTDADGHSPARPTPAGSNHDLQRLPDPRFHVVERHDFRNAVLYLASRPVRWR